MRSFKFVPGGAAAPLCALALAACSTMGPEDARLNAKVQDAIDANPALAADLIEVRTVDGKVNLSGVVDSDTERVTADQIAGKVPGVKKVYDNISVDND